MMKNQRNSFLVATLAALCSVLMLTAGDCSKKAADSNDGGTKVDRHWNEVTFKAVPKAALGGSDNVSQLVTSKNDANIYVVVNGSQSLYRADASKDLFAATGTWDNKPLVTTLDDTAAKAKITGATTVRALAPTKEGVLVSVHGVAGVTGAFFLKGDAYDRAFARATVARPVVDLDALAVADANDVIVGYVATNNAEKEFPYLVGSLTGRPVTGGADLGTTPPTALNNLLPAFVMGPVASSDTRTYIVNATGVNVLAADQVGLATAPTAPATVGTAPAIDGTVGSDKFQVKTKTVANTDVSSALLVNNNLYIALRSAGTATTGGVAVYKLGNTTTAGTIEAPAAEWSNKSVLGLTKDADGKVFAVLADSLVEVKDDATMGAMVYSAAKLAVLKEEAKTYDALATPATSYDKTNFPTGDIVAAEFVGNKLVIGTSTKGVIVSSLEKKVVAAPAE